jgi:GNAT superfamily N-acetyltransferase
MKIIELDADASARFASDERQTVFAIDPALLRRHSPTAHFAVIEDDRVRSRCSIWTQATPKLNDDHVGVIGHYAAADAGTGATILNHASQDLHRRGFRTIVGPMDGNTWRRYRLVTDRGDEPTFFLEPDNPDAWPSHFEQAGFTPLAQYFSALNNDLTTTDPRVPAAEARLAGDGIRIRAIDPVRFEDELKSVHELSLESFASNFLYTPITEDEFLAMYAPLKPRLRPELILLGHDRDEELIGFMFGIPDFNQATRGQPIDTAIAKSMAVRPGRTGGGLGSVLMDRFQQTARALGYTRVIHALMHEENRSMRISHRFGRPMRQYALYVKRL